jgi:hypothetical protein
MEINKRTPQSILEELANYKDATMWNFIKCFSKLSLGKEEIRSCYTTYYHIGGEENNSLSFRKIIEKMGPGSGGSFIKLCFTVYPELLDEVFSDDLDDGIIGAYGINWIRLLLAQSGYVRTINIYDKLTDSSDPYLYLFALEVCSIDKLKEHKSHESKKARKIVFSRLGPVECLNDMLQDGTKDIRALGVRFAPMHCEMFNEMSEEAALQICNNLLKKGDDELIVMLMGNKNNKSNAFSGLLNFRIEEM